ncbi:acetyl-CoA/propionyl-CoA carboxylase biotin carboxyl carrier protein [Nocardiopsis mwathae]|uniref:Biotin-dependent 3-methylcrotonyl-coenzyme A carboxylase alpha1 subunit n=1 Tax=Nocardiopsis mwathae TaxID=1472723 RepID=A0A7X0D739_9ACTN|nr:biotin carboxylase N-terminal domain-containing protein [Nocardiopsis mwathae]MBB6172669.1 acetyl-CoA/propionyl-CoA carboxylase biotin carboxyl carrier protein [Nocardiopsis mwathae]
MTNTRAATAAPTVLVANRGEIAVRIMRTLRRLGMRSVAVYSDGDPDARHVRAADEAVRVGGAGLADSYLNGAAIIDAALATGATMIHPGYGFLSENAGFARACGKAGLVFVGPPPEAIEAMGDKIRAKAAVAAAGVPLLPGFAEDAGDPLSDEELRRAAAEVGFPLLIKPSAGGGGKGMRLVRAEDELAAAAAAARREAAAAFGDATLLVERFVERPRHIEVQVLADAHGNVVHLGERECSLQRRHQKIVEEAPSPLLTEEQRAKMGAAAVAAATACGYVGAGTVEFIVRAAGGAYSFLEMNTRLQVEHPVTEAVTTIGGRRGVDLVELQLRIALGDPLPFSQTDIGLSGHAVESRVYAEDPALDFLPTGGRVLLLDEPEGEHVRVDSGLDDGAEITSAYDPMLAKVITWAPDRTAALDRMDGALARYTLLGCGTNVAFLRRLLRHPDVAAGGLSTDLTERIRPELVPDAADAVPPGLYAAAALDLQLGLEPAGPLTDRFDVPDGWRVGGPAWTTWRLRAPRHDAVAVLVRRTTAPDAPPSPGASVGYEVRVGDGEPVPARAARSADGRTLTVDFGGRAVRYARAVDGADLWLGREGSAWRFHEEPAFAAVREDDTGGDGSLRSPMPGTVLSVPVEQGQRVTAGTPVVVVEAMKMEHAVTAPIDGVVARLEVAPGRPVAMDMLLAVITADGEEADGPNAPADAAASPSAPPTAPTPPSAEAAATRPRSPAPTDRRDPPIPPPTRSDRQ